MKKTSLVILFLLGFYHFNFAQPTSEANNCGDGIDNDGNGYVDCFDGACANNNICDGNYIGKDKPCQIAPPPAAQFLMKLKRETSVNVTTTHGRFNIGDVGHPVTGRDGIPEIVTVHAENKKIFVLNSDLSVRHEVNTVSTPERWDFAIGNVNDDNCAEIFTVEISNDAFFIRAYSCTGQIIWSTKAGEDVPIGAGQTWAVRRPFTLGLADFDQDGKVELYYKNEILDAATGLRLVKGKGDWFQTDAGPVAVDILPGDGLELVLGGEIFKVNLGNRTKDNGTVGNPVKRFNDLPGLGTFRYYPKAINLTGTGYMMNSQTSIADYDLDGELDVIMNGAASTDPTSQCAVFLWNVSKNTYKSYAPKQGGNSPQGWKFGTGRLNVADLDGDGKMNAAFVSGNRLFVLDENFNILKTKDNNGNVTGDWIKTINEETSGFTSTTVFDFNNDNATEIVYRDENNLYIFNGKTGASTSVVCRSLTTNDYPIVADIDADGSTEICVVCAAGDPDPSQIINTAKNGRIRAYTSGLEPWVSARKVWNQHAYFNVNVNDDLTIPRVQQLHQKFFSENKCTTGKNYALNSFLNQSAILDSKGCKTYPTGDLAFLANPLLLNVKPPTCPDQNFLVSFTLKNIGDEPLSGNVPVTFYSGDPRLPGAEKLNTLSVQISALTAGSTFQVQDAIVTGTGKTFQLFAVLNDKGTTPFKLPNASPLFLECNYDNNIVSASVVPKPFALSTLKQDQVQCGTTPSSPNGSTEAFKLEGTVKQTVGYKFYWFNGTTAGAFNTANYVGSSRSPVSNGDYSVYAVHDQFSCTSDTVVVTVGVDSRTITASIAVNNNFTNCRAPNGKLTVTPGSGQIGDYTYEWYEGTTVKTTPPISQSHVLVDAKSLTYAVLVTQKSSNCFTIQSATIPDDTEDIQVSATSTPTTCVPNNTGTVTASLPGGTNGYKFYWYTGKGQKPAADFTGVTVTGLSAGFYTVVAENNATGCTSPTFEVEVTSPNGFAVAAQSVTDQTACVGFNGSATATVAGSTNGFTFQWFEGSNNTSGTPVGTSANISNLKGVTYTVLATKTSDGCTDTDVVTISETKVNPSVAATKVDQTACVPANGSASAIGSGTTGPYVYYWKNGQFANVVDTTSVSFKGSSYVGLSAGTYTVVAVDKKTRCQSDRQVVTLASTTTPPAISHTSTLQTSCDPATPNGTASANVNGNTTNFRFRWFTGTDTTVVGSFIIEASSISNRPSGTYTVKAISKATGCSSVKPVTITEGSAKPVLTLTPVDNAICSSTIGFNGKVTATFSANPNASGGNTYLYTWEKDGVVIPGQTGAVIENLGPGIYSAKVLNQSLGCTSDEKDIEVKNAFVLPVLATASTASTNCSGAANGSAELTKIDNGLVPTTGYTYQWHTGVNITAPISIATNATADDAKLLNVQGGASANYTILVTRLSTGCSNTATVLVGDASEKPVVTLSTVDNSICNPGIAGTSFNGSVQVQSITYKGAPFAGAVTYEWYDGQGTTTPNNSSTGSSLTQLGAGFYSSTVTMTALGCESDFKSGEVKNVVQLPVITTSANGSTNCVVGKENGVANVVTVNGAPATKTGFTFSWSGPTSPAFPVTGLDTDETSLAGLQGGAGYNYTVTVTRLSNGCANTAVINVPDSKVLPVASLSAFDNTMCDPALTPVAGDNYNGSVTASVTNLVGTLSNYTFVFGGGTGTQNANVFSNLNGGITYTVVATHVPTGCVSAQATKQVINTQDLPDITTSSTGSTNCVAGLENGKARVVTVDGNSAATSTQYTYAWTGPTTPLFDVSSNPTRTALELTQVQGGTGFSYTVLVTNLNNGCTNTASVNVADVKVLPALSLTATNNTMCDPTLTPAVGDAFNGVVTASIASPINSLADYNFTFGGGAGVKVANTFTQLNGNITYTATATHALTGCVSSQASVQVLNVQDLPDLVTANTASTNCDPLLPNGKARVVTVDGVAASTTSYTFSWGNASPSVFPVTLATNLTDQPELILVQGGTGYAYPVTVTNLSNGCRTTQSVTVAEAKVIPVLTLTPAPNSICDPSAVTVGTAAFNGSVTAAVTNTPAGNTASNYFFDWNTGSDGNGVVQLPNVDVGTYSVTARHVPTGCTSSSYSAQVTSAKILPAITTQTTPSQNCPGGAPDGSATVSAVTPAGTYKYEWYNGNVATGTPNHTGVTYSNIQGGMNGASLHQYTVAVTIRETGCVNTATVGLAQDVKLPVLGALVPTSNINCGVTKNGEATISTLSYRGSAIPSTSYGDYTFNWSGGTQGPNETIKGLAAGVYTLTVTNIDDACTSNPVSVTITDNLTLPNVTATPVAQTSCDVANPNGQINASVNVGGVATTTGYTFTWFTGNTTTTGLPSTNIDGPNSFHAIKLVGNANYTVRVENDATKCQNTKSAFVQNVLTNPFVNLTVNSQFTQCAPANGQITANVTTAPAAPTQQYTFYWLREQPQTVTTNAATVMASATNVSPNRQVVGAVGSQSDIHAGIMFGSYTVVVKDNFTSCVSQPVTATVLDQSQSNISIAGNPLPSTCALSDGEITVGATRVDGTVATFSFQLFKGGPTNTSLPITFFGNPANDPEFNATLQGQDGGYPKTPVANVVTGLPTSLFTVIATDNFGCKNYKTYFLPFADAHGIDAISVNSKICPDPFNPSTPTTGDGSISIKTIPPPVGTTHQGVNQSQFDYAFYSGGNAIAANLIPVAKIASAPAANPYLYPAVSPVNCIAFPSDVACTSRVNTTASLAPGIYTVEIKENYSGQSCKVYETIEIKQAALPPVVDLASALKPNSACTDASSDGQATIEIAAAPLDQSSTFGAVTYQVQLFEDITGVPIVDNGSQSAGVQPVFANLKPSRLVDPYTVRVATKIGGVANGCTTDMEFVIPDSPNSSQLNSTDVSITDAEYCTPALERSAKVIVSNVRGSSGAVEPQISDFRFDWYDNIALTGAPIFTSNGNTLSANGGDEFINNLPAGSGTVPVGTVVAGEYWVTTTKIANAGATGGVGCTSAPLKVEIKDKSVKPTIALTPTGDTACDPTVFEGSIRVDVTTASGPGATAGTFYSYAWTPTGAAGSGLPVNSGAVNDGVNDVHLNINDGTYSLQATNSKTGCFNALSTTVTVAPPPVFTLTATATALTHCDPALFNGSIKPVQVFVNGSTGSNSQFDFVWYQGDPSTTPVLNGSDPAVTLDTELTLATFPLIAADKYFVKAVRKSGVAGVAGAGCESAPLRRDILDNRKFPQVALTQIASTACNSNYDGQITTTASTAGFPSNTLYDFVWTTKPAGVSIADGINAVSPRLNRSFLAPTASDRVGPGNYEVTVTNKLNGCSSVGSVVVQQNTLPIQVAATTTALSHCVTDNGTATVSGITVNGSTASPADFAFNWTGTGGPFVGTNVNGLAVGDYTVTATKTAVSSPASGCSSAPLTVSVLDNRRFPTVSFNTLASTACNTNYDGQITVSASTTGFAASTLYDFDWTSNPGGSVNITDRMAVVSPSVNRSEALPGGTAAERIGPGAYAITVTNTANGCSANGAVQVQQNVVPVEVIAATSTPLTHCTSDDGSATVQTVQVNGISSALTNFSFAWTGSGGPYAGTTISLLPAGDYFVTATNNAVASPGSGCISPAFKVSVIDSRRFPTLSFETLASTACNTNFDGSITVSAATTGFPATTQYVFDWITPPATSVISDATAVSPRVFQSEAIGGPAGQRIGEGQYTIEVTNTSNTCMTSGSVIVQKNSIGVEVIGTDFTPRTHCVNPDGSVTVTGVIVKGVPASLTDFTFAWTGAGGPYAGTSVSNLDIGDYFVTATKTAVTSPASGCLSAPFKASVTDDRQFPVLSFTTLPSTSCDNNFDGAVEVSATTNGFSNATLYDFDWTSPGPGNILADGNDLVSPYNSRSESIGGAPGQRIGPGNYTIVVTNNTNLCASNGNVTVLNNVVPVEILSASSTPQQICVTPGDGTATVSLTDVRVGGSSVTGGISFAWEDALGAPLGSGASINTLNAGFYFVEATRTAGLSKASGCVSAPFKVEVKDTRENPLVNFTTLPNTSCDNNFDGAISITATTAGFGAAGNYDFVWTNNPGGTVLTTNALNVAGTYTTSSPDRIGAGAYEVRVTNLVTQCFSDAGVTVQQTSPTLSILQATKVDQFNCTPFDGSITVDGTSAQHLNIPGTYSFTWEKAGAAIPTPTPSNTLTGLNAGVYLVTGTKSGNVGSGCVTLPFPVEIIDMTVDPAINIISTPNFACNTDYNGTLAASVEVSSTLTTTGYSFDWFAGANNTNPVNLIASVPNIANRQDGSYTVSVTDLASPGLGCVSVKTGVVEFAPTDFSNLILDVAQTLCLPAQDGSLTLSTVTERIQNVSQTYTMTTPADLARFTFQWFDETGTNPLAGEVSHILDNVFAGEYYLQVTNDLGCTSTITGATIEDETVKPTIIVEDFTKPSLCRMPEILGNVDVTTDDPNLANYTFAWFEGNSSSGPLVSANSMSLSNIAYSSPLEYTLVLTNTLTNCFTEDVFKIEVDTLTIRALGSTGPLTSCIVNDGMLFGAVQEGNSNLYTYEWYNGSTASGTPVYTVKEIYDAPLGVFTVIAKHPSTLPEYSVCVSAPSTVEVLSEQVFPEVQIEEKNPLTYCDPLNPNGVASASVNGVITGYQFEWYVGNVSGAPFYVGNEASDLSATLYTVHVTDNVSGCASDESIVISNDPVKVPFPSVVILSHRTNCVVPDGALSASVNGDIVNYQLLWYDGSAEKPVADNEGEFYNDLMEGLYTTVAVDNTSGCKSGPVVTEILPFQENPDFKITTLPTNCNQQIGEAFLEFLNDVQIYNVKWKFGAIDQPGDTISIGENINQLDKGIYSVFVTSVGQCVTSKNFEIIPDILIFRGVSPNGDSKNDIFEISCIEDFPQNNVKIFNRAGTLVYQADGYNNNDIAFNGISNEGLSLMGRQLPDGTYFYIIDKKDGTRPKSGYLELLREQQ